MPGVSQVPERRRHVRGEPHGLVEVRETLVVPAQVRLHQAAVQVCPRVARVEADRPVVVGDRALVLPLPGLEVTPFVLGADVVRVEVDRLGAFGERFCLRTLNPSASLRRERRREGGREPGDQYRLFQARRDGGRSGPGR